MFLWSASWTPWVFEENVVWVIWALEKHFVTECCSRECHWGPLDSLGSNYFCCIGLTYGSGEVLQPYKTRVRFEDLS
jgi:hypothetical protein